MFFEKVSEQLKRHEGLRLKPYQCTANKLTIGYGRNLEDKGLTKEEAEFLLENDIDNCVKSLICCTWYHKLNDARQAVIINMCYNLGFTKLLKFKKMIAAIDSQDYEKAAKEMQDSSWHTQVCDRALELVEQMRVGRWRAGT